MVIPIPKAIAIGLCVTFFVGQVGCAQSLYLSEDIRTRLGTIGVVSARFAPEVELYLPSKGAGGGAGRGAGKGAAGAFLVPPGVGCYAGPFGCALGLALGLALAVPGAIVGGVYGAIAAEPAESVEEVEARIRQVLAELKMQEALRDWPDPDCDTDSYVRANAVLSGKIGFLGAPISMASGAGGRYPSAL